MIEADDRGGLKAIDISNPMHPRQVAEIPTSHRAVRVAVQQSRVFVADSNAGLQIFEIGINLPEVLGGRRVGNDLELFWPSGESEVILQKSSLKGQEPSWTNLAVPRIVNESESVVRVQLSEESSFFRLAKP